MINFIESLFGLAILALLVAVVLWFSKRRPLAKKWGMAAVGLALLGGILEVYVRMVP
jgi:membrane-bound metal-dependent hydrolase YbcI (DUF457 family)